MSEHKSDHVGAVVRALREQRGISLRALATALSLSPATLSAIENNKVGVSVERLAELADALGVDPSELLPPRRRAGARVPTPTAAVAVPADRTPSDWRVFQPLVLDPALSAAVRLFVRHGFAATTMREIAAEAGLSVAGVYHHYESKHRLLEVAMELTMGELNWRVTAARDEGGSPAERFARMVEALALFHAHRPDLAFVGASEMRSFQGAALDRIRERRNQVQHLIDEQALLAVDDGTFRNEAPLPALRAISTMCTSLPQWFRAGGELTTEQIAAEFARLAVRMMGG